MQKPRPVLPWRRFSHLLRACVEQRNLRIGRRLHALLVAHKLDALPLVADSLIRLYSDCGCLQDAHECFCKNHERSIQTWNAIISAHLKLGSAAMALHLYSKMLQDGVVPDKITFLCTLQASSFCSVREGQLLHGHIIHEDVTVDAQLASFLISFFSNFGCLYDARKVFDSYNMEDDAGVWGSMIRAYVQHGEENSAIQLFEVMLIRGLRPNHLTLNFMVKACGSSTDQVLRLHEEIVREGYESDRVIGSSLVDVYFKLGELDFANKVFRELSDYDVVSWGALISGYTHNGRGDIALDLFCEMQEQAITADLSIFASITVACTLVMDGKQGRIIHHMIVESEVESDVAIGSSLVCLHAACGSLLEAHVVFSGLQYRDIVSWGAIMTGYEEHGYCQTVINLYHQMQEEGFECDRVIALCLLRACSGVGNIRLGWMMHDKLIWTDFLHDVEVGNALVNMYVKCGSLQEAHHLFNKIPERDSVTWGALIGGYAHQGNASCVFQLLDIMLFEQKRPDEVVYLSILKACACTGIATQGRLVHDQIIQYGSDSTNEVFNMIAYMYARCECFDDACKVVQKMKTQDVISWSSLITGLASNGNSRLAETIVANLQLQGLEADDTFYATVVSAYTHGGLLAEGLSSFKTMKGMQTTRKLCNCLIDLFSRTGHLSEAKDLLQTMPSLPDAVGWTSLLTNSKTYGNVLLGKQCFHQRSSLSEEIAQSSTPQR